MNIFYKILLAMIFLGTFLHAAPARSGVKTFTQPDGTTFQGLLRGDSSFHWIESNQEIVLFNKEDKFYYNAIIDETGSLKLSKKRLINSVQKSIQNGVVSASSHRVSSDLKASLEKLYRASKKIPHPQ